jgi:hypothetical protein
VVTAFPAVCPWLVFASPGAGPAGSDAEAFAAVDVEVVEADMGGFVGEQECGSRRDVVRLPEPLV